MLQYLPMTTVALLLGGECTGKTALTEALADQASPRPVSVVPEALRAFTAQAGRPPRSVEQQAIWRRQTALLDKARDETPHGGLIICDPAPLMTAVYSLQYFDDDSLLTPALHETHPEAVFLLCAPDIPWEPDGIQRDGAHARMRTHEILEAIVLPRLTNKVIALKGNLSDRVAKATPYLS